MGWRPRRRALAEARDHLLSAIVDEVAGGAPVAEAERRVAERFGEPARIAESLLAAQPRHLVLARAIGRAAVVVVPWLRWCDAAGTPGSQALASRSTGSS